MFDRLFCGVYPGGIVYADRGREVSGDYARLGFLSFRSLVLEVAPDCPADLRARIIEAAAPIIARRGESFPISACGQCVRLGG